MRQPQPKTGIFAGENQVRRLHELTLRGMVFFDALKGLTHEDEVRCSPTTINFLAAMGEDDMIELDQLISDVTDATQPMAVRSES